MTRAQYFALKRIRDEGPSEWVRGVRSRAGGAISRMFDRMAEGGWCTTPPYKITTVGKRAMDIYEAEHPAVLKWGAFK